MTYDIKALADQAAGLIRQGCTAPDAVNKLWPTCHPFNWIEWERIKKAVLAQLAHRSHAVQRRKSKQSSKSKQKRAEKPASPTGEQLSLRL